MTIKDTIIKVMTSEPKMTARMIGDIIKMDAGIVSKHLSNMVRNGYAFECGTIAGRKLYTLSNKKQSIPRGTIKKYITAHPGRTIEQIANGVPCRHGAVNDYIRTAMRDGLVIRSVNSSGQSVYSVVEKENVPFGCANPMTALFNQLLAEARKNKTNLLQ